MDLDQHPGSITEDQLLGPHQTLDLGAFSITFQEIHRPSDVQRVDPSARQFDNAHLWAGIDPFLLKATRQVYRAREAAKSQRGITIPRPKLMDDHIGR